ncbi:MAG: hypothetical protein IT385_09150 [Deltaproteobacteria bacterium]|nr:hypothetical protein [Deltaproteobacteria bacterium]
MRQDGWFECLATRGAERWLGRGATEAEALEDVLHAMAPSALARGLVAAALGERATSPEVAAAEVAADARQDVAAIEAPPPPASADGDVAGVAPAAPQGASEAPAAIEPPAPEPVVVSEPAPTEGVTVEGPRLKRHAAPPPPPVPARRIDEDLVELELLDERLRFMLPELAVLSRDLQRMGFIAFIARARHIATRAQDSRVEKIVQRIAGRLGELALQLWPGSVRALQLKATPLQAGADLGLPSGGKLHDWAEAAEAAEQLVEERKARLAERGLDELGWADLAQCLPAPNDADARLEQVRHAMEKFFGQLDRASPSETDRELQTNPDKVLPDLVRWAKEVRWLRPHVEERLAWGQAMGRLRWAVTRLTKEARDTLAQLVDEDYRPAKSWPLELGEDPVAKARKKQRSALLKRKPDASVGADTIALWLGEAFELGDAFTTSEIAERVIDLAHVILSIPADEASGRERKFRRRLKSLQDDLHVRVHGSSRTSEGEAAAEVEPVAANDAPSEIDEGDLAFQRLLDLVRERVAGKTALFVSNRADPPLKDKLERELGLAIEWAEIDPRRLQARIESVRMKSYDLVLSATGFQGHSVDATLGRETRAVGLPYVRVNRGRLTTCVRAIARQFGLLEAA